MGGRTWKFSGTQASRGLKQVAGIAKRGFKHIGNAVRNMPKTVANSDTFARKAANTLGQLGDYATLGGAAFGSEGATALGKSLHNMSQSIHDYRRSGFANRMRQDFNSNNGSIMNG